MEELTFPNNITRFSVCGDLHMNYKYAEKIVHQAAKQDAEAIVQLGDFGYTFAPGYLNQINMWCEKYGIYFMFVDGNHEDFDWLLAQPVSEDGVRRLRNHLWHLPRGFRWNWGGVNFLALGGAVSVDRQWRTPGAEWWWQEMIKIDEIEKVCEDGPTDVMFTHDCPTNVDLHLGDGSWIPIQDRHAARVHRDILQRIVDHVQPKHLFHGHYHMKHDTMMGDVAVHGLNCDGNMFNQTMTVCDVAELNGSVDN